MLKLLLVVCASFAVANCNLFNNQDIAPFWGDYRFIYMWPSSQEYVPNCYVIHQMEAHPDNKEDYACHCDGTRHPKLSIMRRESKYFDKNLFVEIVGSESEAISAIGDRCRCVPYTLDRVQFQRINDDFFLMYEQEDVLRRYLFGKKVPNQSELDDVMNLLGDLKNKPGKLMCREDEYYKDIVISS